ncbi:MAG: YigZ family protein [Clostridia bacterium]|nr:YigZ family protein [Clostridia bacterium]
MIQSYITVAGRSSEELIINKSRFIGYAAPCETEDQALSFLREIREAHRSATHHCYAYIIGENANVMRYSDNGEPAGTAGMPIMDVMRTRSIVNCCIVVVRYFGGVLLGTGGLVRAYTQSGQAAVEAAGISRMELTSVEYCEVPYSAWDRVRYASEQLPVRIEDISYGSAISFHLLVRNSDSETVMNHLMDASGRKLETLHEKEAFIPWKI